MAEKSLHELYITRDLVSEKKEKLIAFISEHIAEFNGHTEYKPGIPVMLFERPADAHKFAKELGIKFDIKKDNLVVKARKSAR